MSTPQPKRKRPVGYFTLDPILRSMLRSAANETGASQSAIVEDALRQHLPTLAASVPRRPNNAGRGAA